MPLGRIHLYWLLIAIPTLLLGMASARLLLGEEARLRALANTLGVDQVRYDRDSLVLRFNPQYAADPVTLYLALSRIGKRMMLQSGKRTSLLIRLPGLTVSNALKEGIKALEDLLSRMAEQPEG